MGNRLDWVRPGLVGLVLGVGIGLGAGFGFRYGFGVGFRVLVRIRATCRVLWMKGDRNGGEVVCSARGNGLVVDWNGRIYLENCVRVLRDRCGRKKELDSCC